MTGDNYIHSNDILFTTSEQNNINAIRHTPLIPIIGLYQLTMGIYTIRIHISLNQVSMCMFVASYLYIPLKCVKK